MRYELSSSFYVLVKNIIKLDYTADFNFSFHARSNGVPNHIYILFVRLIM